MSKIKLLPYYLRAAILPFAFIMVISILFLIAHFAFGLGGIYESEWLTDSDMVMSCFWFYSCTSLLMIILCLPLFLNTLAAVRNNFLLSLLSWFLLPVGCFLIIIIHEIQLYSTYGELTIVREEWKSELEGELLWMFFIFPFVLGLLWTFIRFRKQLANEKKMGTVDYLKPA